MRELKIKFAQFFIWILRQMNLSIIINMKVDGVLTPKTKYCFYYQSDFNNPIKQLDGTDFEIPEGPFRVDNEITLK